MEDQFWPNLPLHIRAMVEDRPGDERQVTVAISPFADDSGRASSGRLGSAGSSLGGVFRLRATASLGPKRDLRAFLIFDRSNRQLSTLIHYSNNLAKSRSAIHLMQVKPLASVTGVAGRVQQ